LKFDLTTGVISGNWTQNCNSIECIGSIEAAPAVNGNEFYFSDKYAGYIVLDDNLEQFAVSQISNHFFPYTMAIGPNTQFFAGSGDLDNAKPNYVAASYNAIRDIETVWFAPDTDSEDPWVADVILDGDRVYYLKGEQWFGLSSATGILETFWTADSTYGNLLSMTLLSSDDSLVVSGKQGFLGSFSTLPTTASPSASPTMSIAPTISGATNSPSAAESSSPSVSPPTSGVASASLVSAAIISAVSVAILASAY
jgi:hypothetical protein